MKHLNLNLSRKDAIYVAPCCEVFETKLSHNLLTSGTPTPGNAGNYNSDNDYTYEDDF